MKIIEPQKLETSKNIFQSEYLVQIIWKKIKYFPAIHYTTPKKEEKTVNYDTILKKSIQYRTWNGTEWHLKKYNRNFNKLFRSMNYIS